MELGMNLRDLVLHKELGLLVFWHVLGQGERICCIAGVTGKPVLHDDEMMFLFFPSHTRCLSLTSLYNQSE